MGRYGQGKRGVQGEEGEKRTGKGDARPVEMGAWKRGTRAFGKNAVVAPM